MFGREDFEATRGVERSTDVVYCDKKSYAYIGGMKYKLQSKPFSEISDDDLLRRLTELLTKSRRVEVELIAHIGEVDARRLFASKASSMFVYSTEVLNLSEHEAYLRITVARAARKHPILLEMLSDGRLHLSGIAKLVPLLTETNCETLLARAVHQSKRKIEELVAELSPKPDVPAAMRKLPGRRKNAPPMEIQLGPGGVGRRSGSEQERPSAETTRACSAAPVPAKPAVVEPIAPARWKVQFTASNELRAKIERLRALMRSSVPEGDLAAIIEEAVTEKLERLEAKRFAKTKAPRKSLEETNTSPSSRHIPAAVKRAVCERDQRQCTFVTEDGRRCSEREGLEFHHHKPYGRGGDHSVNNISLVCRCHNGYLAERDYGKAVMGRYRRSSSTGRVSEPTAVYAIGHRAFDLLGPDRARLWEQAAERTINGP